jgi:hypothetical protein
VSDLVVGYCEHPTVAAVESFEAKFLLDCKPAALAEKPVEVDRLLDRCDAVLGKQNNLDIALLKKTNQFPDNPVDALQVISDIWVCWAKTLEVVVEVR